MTMAAGVACSRPPQESRLMTDAPRINVVELTVSELSNALKRAIEDGFGYVRVRGELGNVKYHCQRPRLSRPEGRQGLPRRRDLADSPRRASSSSWRQGWKSS